jgi:hypothetical protein
MRLLRLAARLLDAWAALIVGILVVLAVIILLSTPGPWQDVVGSPPAVAPAEAPRDVAVFVRGASAGDDCTAVVWLHVEHEQPALTAVVVPVQLMVAVPGGGFDQLCRVVRLFGPEVAAGALGEALEVPLSGWVSLTMTGLKAAVPTMFPSGDSLRERRLRKAAIEAWDGGGAATATLRRQTEQLAEALPRVPFETLSIVGVANYALGSDVAESDLDLQRATALATTARDVQPRDVAVRALPVVREARDGAVFWRPRRGDADRLSQSLSLGLRPPRTEETVTRAARPGGILVAVPPGIEDGAVAAFEEGLAEVVGESGGAGIELTTLRLRDGDGPTYLAQAATASRPLAVVLVAAPDGEYAETADQARTLRGLSQPAVLVAPVRTTGDDALPAAPAVLEETGLPLVAVPLPAAVEESGEEEWKAAGRLSAAAAVRACWPRVLAPDLPGTRQGVSYAERRTIELSLVDGEDASGLGRWLTACGYPVETLETDWTPPSEMVRVAYQPGWRRAARAVAGDLGAWPGEVVLDESAPSPVTVVR